jgi:acetoin utilization protein AcuC
VPTREPPLEPLLVFGPRSATYDFGPQHPLTPRRFGPGIELLRAVGAEPSLAPEPASDADLLACHTAEYVATVRAFSDDPSRLPAAGISAGDNPPFAGMHEASAAVAGGSLAAASAIVGGRAVHAFHPGGGLHHAMPGRASGFCVYDDPALAIARFRAAGLRVLYVDLDTHHGDGVQAIHLDDPGVLTFSIHESGEYLFPGTGFAGELGRGAAAGTSVNVPLEPFTGEGAWLRSVEALVPALAATFGPDVIVSQHGADSHAWDPLAHLRVTTTAMGAAARLVDAVAHRFAGGRWLATGGGGYDAYRVVPRTWSLVWLAGAHRETPPAIPDSWRERWTREGERFHQAPLPTRFDDEPNAGRPIDGAQEAAERTSLSTLETVRALVLPAVVRVGIDRGWLDPLATPRAEQSAPDARGPATIVASLDRASFDRLALAERTLPLADPAAGRALLAAALADGARVATAIAGDSIVGVAVVASAAADQPADELLALGVAPGVRRQGIGAALLGAIVAEQPAGRPIRALVTAGERDAFEPLEVEVRAAIARRLLEGAGFRVHPAAGRVGREDPTAIEAVRA